MEPLDFASLKTPKSQFVTGPSKCSSFRIKQLPQRSRMVVPTRPDPRANIVACAVRLEETIRLTAGWHA